MEAAHDVGPDTDVTEMQSLCMNCGEQGVTRIMLTSIPFFKIVKSDTATISFPELDFEEVAPDVAEQVEKFIAKLNSYANGEIYPFTVKLDDPTGNSYIENPRAPAADPSLTVRHYRRTPQQSAALGLNTDESAFEHAVKEHVKEDAEAESDYGTYSLGEFDKFDYKKQVVSFAGRCPNCNGNAHTRMVAVDIPFFKEIILMATTCDDCSYRNSEVKGGGAIPDKGQKITFKFTKPEDLNRDVLKSETGEVFIPELDLEVQRGTLGGRFTTIEGLLTAVREDLQKADPFAGGDSAQRRERYRTMLAKLDGILTGSVPFTLIMDDPLGNCYVQNPTAPQPDPNLLVEEYKRSWEQDEEFGLNDIKTEGYENDATTEANSAADSAKKESSDS